jgi:hypothetical protein
LLALLHFLFERSDFYAERFLELIDFGFKRLLKILNFRPKFLFALGKTSFVEITLLNNLLDHCVDHGIADTLPHLNNGTNKSEANFHSAHAVHHSHGASRGAAATSAFN